MENLLSYLLTAVLLTIISVVVYYKHSYDYWKKKGIATISPKFPFGNFTNPFFGKEGITTIVRKLYKEFRLNDVKIGGLYAGATPLLMAVHPDIIKDILSKDFQYFASHGNTVNEETEPLLAHLFNMEGEKWKDMRVKLTPTFTSGKMKMMYETVLDCGKQMEEFMNKYTAKNKTLEIKEISSCYTTDVIGSCAFGLDCNSFKTPDAEFRTFGRKLFVPNIRVTLRRFIDIISPKLTKLLKINFFDKNLQNFFLGVVKDMVYYRETKEVSRNDFMQLLINLQKQAKLAGKEVFTLEQMAAQALVFFIAGFETSSTTMTFCLYELAHHQDIQDKVREEINRTLQKYDGKLTYDAVMEMKYLEQVINETLRKYPPVPALPRICTQDYQLSNGSIIEKGTKVFISVLGLHLDEEYFPNPNDFLPDRFSNENKQDIRPYTFLPFGEGPRLCIGFRFAMMQTKVGICSLLKDYKLFPEVGLRYPLEFDDRSFILSSKETILLRAERV